MNDNVVNKKSFLSQVTEIVKTNIRNIIILLSLCFVLFLFFQIYSFYISNKIQKNSISFFKLRNKMLYLLIANTRYQIKEHKSISLHQKDTFKILNWIDPSCSIKSAQHCIKNMSHRIMGVLFLPFLHSIHNRSTMLFPTHL